MITDEQLSEWERLANEATPGLWVHETGNFESLMWDNGYVLEYTTSDDGIHGNKPGDIPFIAASRTTVPLLIAEVRRLRAELHRTGAALIDSADKIRQYADEMNAIRTQMERHLGSNRNS